MASCAVCGKREEEVALFDGIYNNKLTKICYPCSRIEEVMLIRKPTAEQLAEAEKRKSVRELMENMSMPQKRLMTKDNIIAHKDLAKLRFPGMKQEHGDLISNYDWVLKNARRHMKLSTTQIAEKAGVQKAQIESLEGGQLFNGFEKVAAALENVLNVKILKASGAVLRYAKPSERIEMAKQSQPAPTRQNSQQESREKGIFASVKRAADRFRGKEIYYDDRENEIAKERIDINDLKLMKEKEREEKKKRLDEEISSDKFDFSRRENLDNISLQDLAELKKLREKRENLI
jgi:ribosome-binding protein aMBF1 (putative translation factor)